MMAEQPAANGIAERFGLQTGIPREADGKPQLQEDEELAGTYADTNLLLGDSDQGVGTLFLSTRRVIWFENGGSGHSFAVPYPSIGMHAVSSDAEAFQRPCIYMQIDLDGPAPEGDDDDEEALAPEMRLVPADAAALDAIFAVLCDCAAKNPDPGQSADEEDGDFFYDEDEVLAGAAGEERAAQLDQYDALLQMPRAAEFEQMVANEEGRFDDADESMDDNHRQ